MKDLTDHSSIRNLLVLHAGALGDCVLTLHVAAAARATLPHARVELTARSVVADFAVGRGPIHAAWRPEQVALHHLYGHADVPGELTDWLTRYDLMISFLAGPQAHVSVRLAEVARCPVISVDPAPRPDSGGPHITAQWLSALRDAGLDLAGNSANLLTVTDQEREAARTRLGELAGSDPDRIVVCHPGAGSRDKCCPLDVLEEVVACLRRAGLTALWMVGPTEHEWYGSDYTTRLSRTAPTLFEESVPDAAVLLTGADAFLGNDAGITHLAAGLGLQTVALFGPTDPAVWAPLGPSVEVLRFDPQARDGRLTDRIVDCFVT
jgi:ADP-heptose:LPS heptosyltransferase